MMSESFWWNLLAGFLIGFAVSTLWEWLYFRRRRTAIRNRRIAELEATLRTYAAAGGASPTSAVASNDWNEPPFDNPHVYLETEEPAQAAAQSTPENPASAPAFQAAPVVLPARDVTAPASSLKVKPDNVAPEDVAPEDVTPGEAQPTVNAPRGGFQSVAVQQPTSAASRPSPQSMRGATQAQPQTQTPHTAQTAAAAPAEMADHEDRSRQAATAATAAAITATAVARHVSEETTQPAEQSDAASSGLSDSAGATRASTQSIVPDAGPTKTDAAQQSTPPHNGRTAYYANGRMDGTHEKAVRPADSPPPSPGEAIEEAQTRASAMAVGAMAASQANKPITSGDLDALAASINNLIETVNKEPATTPLSPTNVAPKAVQEEGPYTTKITGKTEFVLVRLVQTFVQFFRQVRAILSGDDAEKPVIHPSGASVTDPAARRDDLTQIAGLTQAHADRLRIGGVVSFAQVAALSTDELRLMTFTPGAAPADYTRWRAEAAQLAVTRKEASLP